MQRLNCHVKEYAWGKKGTESEVANLFAAGHQQFQIGNNTPYAELWMGTHPDGPARVAHSNVRLSAFIAKSQGASYLSNNNDREDVHLPFIMKVMSIRHTLSLQVHPTKEQAVRLHERDPAHYPDRHHKPELAYALTRFELLCGFRPAGEMVANMRAFSPLRVLMGPKNCDKLIALIEGGAEPRGIQCKIALATCFKHQLDLNEKDPDQVEALLEELQAQLDKGVRGALTEGTVQVIRKMYVDFPGDVGVFAPLYVNHVVLEPGQCCFYAAQELHAYLSGECVECVGCSNNTIRAAMTPKFIDTEALCEVLNYQMTDPREYLVPPQKLADYPCVDEYAPDCKDFQLHRIRVIASSEPIESRLPALDCASIMVVVEGEADITEEPSSSNQSSETRTVRRGDVIYIPPAHNVAFTKCTRNMEAYRTFSYEIGPDHDIKPPTELPLSSPAQKISDLPAFAKVPVNVAKYPVTPLSRMCVSLDAVKSKIFEVESEMDGFC